MRPLVIYDIGYRHPQNPYRMSLCVIGRRNFTAEAKRLADIGASECRVKETVVTWRACPSERIPSAYVAPAPEEESPHAPNDRTDHDGHV